MTDRDLSSYIEVATRIADFRAKYPEGTLSPANPAEPWRLVQAQGFEKDGTVSQQTFIVVVAAAYRTADDPSPGVGMAWEIFPGRTPYTRGSELQNAETSAWGRAIIAVGASDSKAGIASREEVANRRAEREEPRQPPREDREHYCLVESASGLFRCAMKPGHEGLHDYELPRNKDGSLSRSRTTDEEKDAAGVMTDPQQRAHNQLRRDGEPAAGRVEKTSGSEPDQWQTPPGHWAEGALPPEDEPGSSTPQQRQHIALKLGEIGLADQEKARAWCSLLTGREIATRKDLSFKEGRMLLDEVDKVIAAKRKAAASG